MAAGERVPGAADLMKLFDVGEHTARRALQEIKDEGLIVVDRGHGTFVRKIRSAVRTVLGEPAQGHPFWPTTNRETRETRTHEWTTRSTLDVAVALKIRPGSDVRVHHTYSRTARREIQIAVTYRPIHLTGAVAPVRFRDELRVRLPNAPERDRMELTIATPVIDLARTVYAANDEPVELIHMVMDASAYLLEYHHPATNRSAAGA